MAVSIDWALLCEQVERNNTDRIVTLQGLIYEFIADMFPYAIRNLNLAAQLRAPAGTTLRVRVGFADFPPDAAWPIQIRVPIGPEGMTQITVSLSDMITAREPDTIVVLFEVDGAVVRRFPVPIIRAS